MLLAVCGRVEKQSEDKKLIKHNDIIVNPVGAAVLPRKVHYKVVLISRR